VRQESHLERGIVFEPKIQQAQAQLEEAQITLVGPM
jgi:hypothetical protein